MTLCQILVSININKFYGETRMNLRKDSELSLATCIALKSLFHKSGKTLDDVSLETGITISTLSRTHNFERVPSFVDALLLCKCYGVTAQELADLVEKMKSDSPMLESFRNLRALTKEIRNKFCDTA